MSGIDAIVALQWIAAFAGQKGIGERAEHRRRTRMLLVSNIEPGDDAVRLARSTRADVWVGVTTDGSLYRSSDAGRSWDERARAPGQVQAFDAGTGSWHLASDEGLFSSTDQGLTWVQLL